MNLLLTNDTMHRLCRFIWITNNLRMKELLIKAGSLHCLRHHTVDRSGTLASLSSASLRFGSALAVAVFTVCPSKLGSLRPQRGTTFSAPLAHIIDFQIMLDWFQYCTYICTIKSTYF
jgi:hypothetical protein